jgi:hypothetical protein
VAQGVPEFFQAAAGTLPATAVRIAIGQDGGIDGAGAGGADTVDLQAPVVQQTVEYAPTEGTVGAAALQAEVDFFQFTHMNSLPVSGGAGRSIKKKEASGFLFCKPREGGLNTAYWRVSTWISGSCTGGGAALRVRPRRTGC